MPVIFLFYGINITMYFGDHPPPHFHVITAEYAAKVAIENGSVIAGSLPKTAYNLVKRWAIINRDELAANWERAMNDNPLHRIEGLK